MIEIILALAMVVAGQGAAASLRLSSLAALKTTAASWIQSEVMEEWETSRFYNASSFYDNFLDHQAIMAERLAEMEIDCPRAMDVKRLPSDSVCRENLMNSWRYQRWLEWQLSLAVHTPAEEEALKANLADTEWRRKFWDLASDCHTLYAQNPGRRLLLQRMRKLIGRVNYDDATWPDPLPPSGYYQEWIEKPFEYP